MGYDEHAGSEPPALQVYVPDEHRAGAYAHMVSVWHTAYEFTIDFAVTDLADDADRDEPEAAGAVTARVVSRVRLPPGFVFDLMRTINANMEEYEAFWGDIRRPEPRRGGEP